MLCLISAAITATNEIGGNYKPDMNGCYFQGTSSVQIDFTVQSLKASPTMTKK